LNIDIQDCTKCGCVESIHIEWWRVWTGDKSLTDPMCRECGEQGFHILVNPFINEEVEMPEVELPADLGDVKEGGALEGGVYQFEVFKAEVRPGKAAPYINWECKCIEPGFEGRTVYEMTSLAENALWKLKGFLKAMGWNEPIGKKFNTDKFVGRKFQGEVVVDNYQDPKTGETKKNNKFLDYFPIGANPDTNSSAPAATPETAEVTFD